MGKVRKQFSKELKAKVALEALKEEKTLSELSSEYSVHPTQIKEWKNQLKKEAANIFSRRKTQEEKDQEKLVDRLYRQVGELQMENDWFKKKLPL